MSWWEWLADQPVIRQADIVGAGTGGFRVRFRSRHYLVSVEYEDCGVVRGDRSFAGALVPSTVVVTCRRMDIWFTI